MKKENLELYLKQIQEDWPSPFVARCKIQEFTKGMYKAASFRSYDALKYGVKNKYTLGTKVFYTTKDVINWLKNKLGD